MSSKVTLSVIVYGAKGLKPKHKGKHKFLVVFGVGSNKYRTDVVEDLFDNPIFNTESEIEVDDPTQPLSLVVSEKHEKDVLGQVTVLLSDLSTVRPNKATQVFLKPHKRCPNPEGELSFEAWISSGGAVPRSSLAASSVMSVSSLSVRSEDQEGKKHILPAGLKKLRSKIGLSPMLSRKSSFGKEHKRSSSDSLRMQGSMSCHDLSTAYSKDGLKMIPQSKELHSSASSLESLADSSLSGASELMVGGVINTLPEITGVSPIQGSTSGGTKIIIRGANLGRNKEDVIGLFVCGSNVLGSLEYVSSSKLICTTKPWRACSGNVTVETQSNGKGTSSIQFTFGATEEDQKVSGGDVSDVAVEGGRSALVSSGADTSNLKSLRSSLRGARSMFDVSSAGMSPMKALPPGPEVTGVSPAEANVEQSTKVTIRGLNLGQSRADITRVTICGLDFTDTVEYESPSKITCIVGPCPNAGTERGGVVVETKSGGRGSCLVQFGFIVREEERGSTVVNKSGVLLEEREQIVDDINSENDSEQGRRSTGVIRIDRQNKDKVSPPVGEIQPMRVDAKKTSPHHHKGLFRKRSDKSLVDGPDQSPETVVTKNRDSPEEVKTSRDEVPAELFTELQRQLLSVEDKSNKLLQDNKQLKEENDRMKKYMESLISRAMIKCPDILCTDMS